MIHKFHHNHHIRLFSMLAWVRRIPMKDFQAFLSLAIPLLTFLSFKSLLITSFHVFHGCPQGKLPLTLKVLPGTIIFCHFPGNFFDYKNILITIFKDLVLTLSRFQQVLYKLLSHNTNYL